MQPIVRLLLQILKIFTADRKASVVITFAFISSGPSLLSAGLVEIIRARYIQDRLQSALDAATLSAVRLPLQVRSVDAEAVLMANVSGYICDTVILRGRFCAPFFVIQIID